MTGSSRTVFDQNAARVEFSGKLVTVNQQAIAEWAHGHRQLGSCRLDGKRDRLSEARRYA